MNQGSIALGDHLKSNIDTLMTSKNPPKLPRNIITNRSKKDHYKTNFMKKTYLKIDKQLKTKLLQALKRKINNLVSKIS